MSEPEPTAYRGDEYYLTQNCDLVIDVPGNKDVVLYSQSGVQYTGNQDCVVTLKARPGKKSLVTFSIFDVNKNDDGTCEDALELYDGNDDSAPALTPANGLCGVLNDIADFYDSSAENITIKFTTGASGFGGGFTVIVTSVSNGTCEDSEFECDNGLCIDPNLKDNLRDNCGDKSDENELFGKALTLWEKLMDFGLAAAIGILVAGVIVLIILIVCLACCICKCCCKKVSPV
ncbi:low-density lipoprotein receptor-related protein 3-like [Glandiceps talaboti]